MESVETTHRWWIVFRENDMPKDPKDSQGGWPPVFRARAPLSNVFLMRRHRDTWKRSEKETWETMAETLIWRALDRTLLLAALSPQRTLCYCHLFFHGFFRLPAPGLSATLTRGFKERKRKWRKSFDWLQNSYWPLLDIIFTPLPSYKRNDGRRVRMEPVAWERNVYPPWTWVCFSYFWPSATSLSWPSLPYMRDSVNQRSHFAFETGIRFDHSETDAETGFARGFAVREIFYRLKYVRFNYVAMSNCWLLRFSLRSCFCTFI